MCCTGREIIKLAIDSGIPFGFQVTGLPKVVHLIFKYFIAAEKVPDAV